MKENNLIWLEKYYLSICKKINSKYGESADYYYGIKINTIDNPGWSVEISLEEASIPKVNFKEINYDNGDNDWINCKVENSFFKGFGDPTKLDKIIGYFREWIELSKR